MFDTAVLLAERDMLVKRLVDMELLVRQLEEAKVQNDIGMQYAVKLVSSSHCERHSELARTQSFSEFYDEEKACGCLRCLAELVAVQESAIQDLKERVSASEDREVILRKTLALFADEFHWEDSVMLQPNDEPDFPTGPVRMFWSLPGDNPDVIAQVALDDVSEQESAPNTVASLQAFVEAALEIAVLYRESGKSTEAVLAALEPLAQASETWLGLRD